jgi:hypothetical protein
MTELLKINKTEKGNFVGHVQTKETKKTCFGNTVADKYYFVRLADDKMKTGEIKDFDIKDFNVNSSYDDDGNRFDWLEPK